MGRKIDLTKELSEADRNFLIARDKWPQLQQNADNLGVELSEVVGEHEEGDEPNVRVPRQGQDEPAQTPDATHPAPAALGQRQRLASEEYQEVTIETDDNPYEDWHNKTLRDENHKRGMPQSGNKQTLVDRLRGWDEDHEVGPSFGDAESDGDDAEDED